ncbi:MAG TPA: helix-turn-helix domain-containing protein [Gemmataceae bacterium]|jgi:DNA-binding CsgD family transcriptional regulator|nr:helix-turn-helix domain-containing protein [Gemmataceae bacterium]
MSQNVPKVSQNVPPGKNFELPLILAAGATVTATAEKLGISRKTIHRKLRKPAFRKLVAELRGQLFSAALGRMAENMTRATDSLASLLDASDPAVKLRASRTILSLAMRLRDSVDVSDRISELEGELARKQGVAP